MIEQPGEIVSEVDNKDSSELLKRSKNNFRKTTFGFQKCPVQGNSWHGIQSSAKA